MNVLTAMGAVAVWDALTAGVQLSFFGPPHPAAETSGHAAATGHGRRAGLVVALGIVVVTLAMQVAGLR